MKENSDVTQIKSRLKTNSVELTATTYAGNISRRGIAINVSSFNRNLLREVVNQNWKYLNANINRAVMQIKNEKIVVTIPIEGTLYTKDINTSPDILSRSSFKIINDNVTAFKRAYQSPEWDKIFSADVPRRWKLLFDFEKMVVTAELYGVDEAPVLQRNSFAGENADTGCRFTEVENGNISVYIFRKVFRELSYIYSQPVLTNFRFNSETDSVSFDIRNSPISNALFTPANKGQFNTLQYNLLSLSGIDYDVTITEERKAEILLDIHNFREYLRKATNNGESFAYASFVIDKDNSRLNVLFDRTDLIRGPRENSKYESTGERIHTKPRRPNLSLDKMLLSELEAYYNDLEAVYNRLAERAVIAINNEIK